MFFIQGKGIGFLLSDGDKRGLRDLRWNRWGRGREGCYFEMRGSGVVPTV